MSDKIRLVENATDTQTRPTISHRWLIFFAIVLVVVILLGVFLLSNSTSLDGVKRFFRYNRMERGEYGNIKFENYGSADCRPVGECLAVGTQGLVTLYAEDGTVLCRHAGAYAAPTLCVNGECLLSYDIGGNHLAVSDTDGVLRYELDTAGLIYDADLSEEGAACVLTNGSDCRAVLEVYSESGTLLFRRSSKTSYLNTCALSPDREFAAVTTLGQEDIAFASSVQIFDTASDTVYAELSLGSQLIYELKFLNEKTLCAVGENSLVFLTVDGTVLNEYTVEGGELMSCSFDGSGFVAAVYDLFKASGRYRLLTLDESGSVIAYASLDSAPVTLSACKQYVAVLSEHKLQIFNRELKELHTAPNSSWKSAYVRFDGTVYGIASDEATLLIP